MRGSCAVCFLAVALCLVVCVSANEKVTEGDATTAVEDVKAFVTAVRDTAQNHLDNVKSLLDKVKNSKRKAEKAALKSQTAANDNTEAVAIATEVKSLSDAVGNSYSDAKRKLVTVVNSLTTVLEEAKQFVSESTIEITPNTDTTDEFSETKGRATTLKGKAEDLNRQITAAVTPVAGVEATANEMENKATEAQLKDSQVSAIVALAKIKSMLGNANNILPQIEEKKNAVNGIVNEMKTFKTDASTLADENIKAMQQSAADALRDATEAVENANNAKAAIEAQKDCTTAALTKVEAEGVDVSKAEGEVQKAEDCVTAAGLSFSQLNNALQTAVKSFTNANDSKQQLKAALSKTTSKTGTDQSVTHSQVKPLQDSVIADVKTIQSMMEETDGTLQETKKHKKAVHDVVQEMKKHCTNELTQSNDILKEQCQRATDALNSATGAVDEAKNAAAAIKEQKSLADTALENVQKKEIDVTNAQLEVSKAKACVTTAEENVEKLNNALKKSATSLTSANLLKQQIVAALSTTTSKPSTGKIKAAEKPVIPVEEGTGTDQKDATTQPTTTDTEQPPSKELPEQSNNSTDKLKDALINGAQNVATTALTGGKAPAPGAKNDSAMTVSVSLLVALIASAVLQ